VGNDQVSLLSRVAAHGENLTAASGGIKVPEKENPVIAFLRLPFSLNDPRAKQTATPLHRFSLQTVCFLSDLGFRLPERERR